MAFRRLVEECGVSRLTVVGLDPLANSAEHFRWFKERGGRVELPPDRSVLGAETVPDSLRDPEAKFVSIDLDCIDQASAPGVSAMNPAGLPARVAAAYSYAAGRSHAVRCFDIMELCPAHDEGGRTARLAAHLFLCFLNGFSQRA
jgi:arginase family enzyme